MIKSKNITILGTGISGLGSAKLANKLGLNVFVSDNNIIGKKIKKYLNENKIDFEENGHDIRRLLSADQVIISPGISFVDLKKRYNSKIIGFKRHKHRITDIHFKVQDQQIYGL